MDTLLADGTVAVRVTQFHRGHSNLTYLVERGGSNYVLRRPPNGMIAKSAHDMAREHLVLSRLWRGFPTAPRSLAYCPDALVIGAPFFIMEHKAGVVFGERASDDATTRQHCLALVDTFAELHHVDYRKLDLEVLGRPVGFIRRQVDGWRDRYRRVRTHDHDAIDRLGAWLDANVPSDDRAAILHNDFKFDNLLFNNTTVSAVLDWEMCTLGDPLMDLGLLLTYWATPDDGTSWRSKTDPSAWIGALTRREVVERYVARSGSPVPDMDFYLAFGAFKLAVILQQLYARWTRGESRDERFESFAAAVAELGQSGLRAAGGEPL